MYSSRDSHPGDPAHFERDGYALIPALLSARECEDLCASAAAAVAADTVGTRCLLAHDWCAALAERLLGEAALSGILPRGHVAVQCTWFEKSRHRNWLVPAHQDLSIPVAARVDDEALGAWSLKEEAWHVQPPAALLEQLVAVRVHLDDCGEADGALSVAAGSHRGGRLEPATAAASWRSRARSLCALPRGGAMAMRPLLLHASSKATGACRRRVLHYLFGPADLPHGLQWARSYGANAGVWPQA
jgi:hypothetical protein